MSGNDGFFPNSPYEGVKQARAESLSPAKQAVFDRQQRQLEALYYTPKPKKRVVPQMTPPDRRAKEAIAQEKKRIREREYQRRRRASLSPEQVEAKRAQRREYSRQQRAAKRQASDE